MAKAKKKEEALTLPERFGAVVYTDGGAKPNPGPTGWGVHGYYYQVLKPKKGSGLQGWTLTNTGYVLKKDVEDKNLTLVDFITPEAIAKAGESCGEITPIHYMDGHGAYDADRTNNVGEIDAAYRALLSLKDYVLTDIHVITDSKMVVKAMTEWRRGWVKNGWKNSRGEDVSNADLWQRLIDVADSLTERGVAIHWTWTPAHVGHVGNETADSAASAGVNRSMESRAEQQNGDYNEFTVSPADGYWKTEAVKHPFIASRRMYFNDAPNMHQPGHYYFGEHGKEDDLLGTRVSEGALSVVRLTTPDPTLEMLVERHHTIFNRNQTGMESLIIGRLDHLFGPKMTRWIERYGTYAMQQPRGHAGLFDLSNPSEPISVNLSPRGISGRVVDELCALERHLDRYLAAKETPEALAASTYAVTDLVPILYDITESVDKKTKESVTLYTLKAEYNTGFAVLPLSVNYVSIDGNGKPVIQETKIHLQLGVDLPSRNYLKRMETLKPDLNVLTWSVSEQCFRYAVVGRVADASAIWAGVYSNTRYLNGDNANQKTTKKSSKVSKRADSTT